MNIILESNDRQSLEELEKEKEYIRYIDDHRANVVKAFNTYFLPLLDEQEIESSVFNTVSLSELQDAIRIKQATIANHDESKYADIEFLPYRKHWYPTSLEKALSDEEKKDIEEKYEEAWHHHYKVNPHHQKYWLNDDGTFRDMDLPSIIEMICDWEAISTHFGQNTLEWYNSDKAKDERNNMTEKTKDIVEELLYKILKK